MENLVFTQLSIPEIRQLFRQELQTFFESKPIVASQHESESLLTIQQAAELLNLAVPTIYGMVSRSVIPVSKRGKRLYFTKHELTEWVKAGRKKTAAEIQTESEYFISKRNRK